MTGRGTTELSESAILHVRTSIYIRIIMSSRTRTAVNYMSVTEETILYGGWWCASALLVV